MEHSLNVTKAKEISSYIKAIYGERNLGIVRLLSSVPYFRQSVVRGKLSDLIGMSLISFEKYLREEHNIIYRYDGATFVIERLGGCGRTTVPLANYKDDVFFSVGGAVVDAIRGLYPDSESLNSVPLVSLGRGLGIDHMLSNANIPAICAYIKLLPESYIDDTITADVIDYGTLLGGGLEIPRVKKYKVVDALHQLYVRLRREPVRVCQVQELPACDDADFMKVCMGVKSASVVPPQGGTIPKILLQALQEAHPAGVIRDGGFYVTGQVELDPFQYIGSTRIPIELPDFTQLPSPVDTQTKPVCVSGPKSDGPGEVEAVDEMGPGFEEAVGLVLQYVETNINDLDPQEKEIALYGFIGGEHAFKKMSNAAQKNVAKTLVVGDYEPTYVIYKIATFIRTNLKHREKGITAEQFALMAAGRIVAWKGNWVINPDGVWRKNK